MRKSRTIPFDYEVDENGCFNITSHKPFSFGYSVFHFRGVKRNLHRHVYEEMFGEIPEGLVVRHKCDNRLCINPEHLEIGTRADNNRDMYERGRSVHLKGEDLKSAKLTEQQVRKIKESLINGESESVLAERYGVTKSAIEKIRLRKNWAHVVVENEENMPKKNIKRHFITIHGQTKSLKDWCRLFGFNYQTVFSRISKQGMSDFDALMKSIEKLEKRDDL